jgi:hypothetical protein
MSRLEHPSVSGITDCDKLQITVWSGDQYHDVCVKFHEFSFSYSLVSRSVRTITAVKTKGWVSDEHAQMIMVKLRS